MTGTPPSPFVYPDFQGGPKSPAGVRSDLDTMLMPFFPEDAGLETFSTRIGGYAVTMHTTIPGGSIATAGDRKILNLLAARVGEMIGAGLAPTRHIAIGVRDIIDAISCDGVTGGSEYKRISARLERLASTWITTEVPLEEDVSRERRFRWIDAWEQDVRHSPGGQKILRLKISLSVDAFQWITRNEGFEITAEEFHALTASRSSSWRIYEICLAQLMRNGGDPVHIQIDDLRRRIPITSELKLFRARTLKSSMKAIAENPQMSRTLRLRLERLTENGFEPVPAGKRTLLDTLHVRVERGPDPLPETNRLISETDGHLVDVDDLAMDGAGSDDKPSPTLWEGLRM